jgi:MutS domain III
MQMPCCTSVYSLRLRVVEQFQGHFRSLQTRVMLLFIQTRPRKDCPFLVRSGYIPIDCFHIMPAIGVLNVTKTNLGRQLLRTWLLRPSLSLSTISKRHDAVECFTRPENLVAVDLMHNHLKGLKNTPKILKALISGKAQLFDWQGFVKVCLSSHALLRWAYHFIFQVHLPHHHASGRTF